MKSFQNKNHEFRTLKTRPCVHGRSSLKNLSCGHRQNPPINQCHNSVGKKQQSFIKPKEDDQHTKMMRSLIAMNEDYFQDKLHVSNDGKPSRLKLKIPSQTGFTVYKRDYIKNLNNHMQLKKTHQFKQSKVKADFFAGTTYRNQFLGKQNEDEKFIRKKEQKTNLDAPTFNESQYKHNFLNWGSGSHMPSMKPHPSPATTNLPFHPSTMYSTEFTAKQNRKKQNFNPNNSSCLSLNSNHIASPLLYLTTNDVFFDKKNNSKEGNLKPKTHTLAIDGGAFKGKTEYQSEFVKQKGSGVLEESGKKPLNELQNMILNL